MGQVLINLFSKDENSNFSLWKLKKYDKSIRLLTCVGCHEWKSLGGAFNNEFINNLHIQGRKYIFTKNNLYSSFSPILIVVITLQ